MRLRFVFLRWEICSLELCHDQAEIEAEDGEAELSVGGGSGHNFERDANPLSAVGEEPWPWETDRQFGFQA